MRRGIVGALLLLGSAGIALACSSGVTNEDNQNYEYTIECGGSSSSGTFHHGHNAFSSSVSGCKLKVKGAGSAKVENSSCCVIKDHMLDCN